MDIRISGKVGGPIHGADAFTATMRARGVGIGSVSRIPVHAQGDVRVDAAYLDALEAVTDAAWVVRVAREATVEYSEVRQAVKQLDATLDALDRFRSQTGSE